ncbi:MAG TPA: DinB family protein [Chryseolinea sp.]|nr:DinB family protein [Chryseolinea sp.]
MNFFTESILTIIDRDLNKLEEEIKLYPSEDSLWKISGGVKNPGGDLCLHLCGNLQHYIGAVLGNSGYARNRDQEFATKNIPRTLLISEIHKTKGAVRSALEKLDPGILDKEYPERVFGYSMTTGHFLIHLTSHLGYHLGQVNYLRRLL